MKRTLNQLKKNFYSHVIKNDVNLFQLNMRILNIKNLIKKYKYLNKIGSRNLSKTIKSKLQNLLIIGFDDYSS